MENKDSAEESGELTYRKLDVPIITSEALEPVITTFLSAITDDQWVLLADDHIDFDTFTQLYDMCHEVTNVITTWILNVVEPQIQNWMCTEAAQDPNMRHCDYYSLTKDNVKTSIGNSFDHCFSEVTGIPQERSNESIILLELFAAEVKKRVNQSLAGLISSAGQSASCPQIESIESYDSDTTQMVYQAGSILKFLLKKDTKSPKIANIEHSSPKEPSPEDITMCPVPKMQSSGHQVLCSAKGAEEENMEKWKNMEDICLEEFSPTSPKSTGRMQQAFMASSDVASEEGGTSSSKEQRLNKPSGKNRSFGHKVRTFFNRKTNKVAPACDLNTSVSHSCAEDATIMHTVPNMQRSDSQSEETLVNFSSSELLNNSPVINVSCGHILRTFFSKLTLGRPDETTESEEFSEDSVTPTCENGSTQSSKQSSIMRSLSSIMRSLSSTGKILKKPFTCCMSAE